VESLDELAAALQEFRISAGAVTYREIAARISQRREAEGLPPGAARAAVSSVYDAFRAGRARTNPELVAEIALALGADGAAAEGWRQRCLAARQSPVPGSLSPREARGRR